MELCIWCVAGVGDVGAAIVDVVVMPAVVVDVDAGGVNSEDDDDNDDVLMNECDDDNDDSLSLAIILAFGIRNSLFTFLRMFLRFFTLLSFALAMDCVRTSINMLLMLLLLLSLLLLLMAVLLLLLLFISALLLIWHVCDNELSSENGFAFIDERPLPPSPPPPLLSMCISI